MTTYTISYAALAQITDLARFVRLFEASLLFGEHGLTIAEGEV